MTEYEYPVQTYLVAMRCNCGVGNMLPTGIMLCSNPPQYPHKCTECGLQSTFDTKYPFMITKEIGAEK